MNKIDLFDVHVPPKLILCLFYQEKISGKTEKELFKALN